MLCSLLKEDLTGSQLIWMHQIRQTHFSQTKEKCQDKHGIAFGYKAIKKTPHKSSTKDFKGNLNA